MPEYRRNRVAGGTFFFTVILLDRRADLLVRHVDVLREAVRRVRLRAPFRIDAWVGLPDHMHCLRTLLEGGERGIWQRRYWEHTIRTDRDFAAYLDNTRR